MRIDEKSQEQPARQSKEDSQAPWRIEAEIDQARQEHLTRCLATVPDIIHGVYPFKGMKLNQADIEWLLSEFINGNIATAASGDEGHPPRPGLDLRGADLQYADLHAFPLTHLRGSLTCKEWDEATTEQRVAAEVLLTGADLSEAHLEHADLSNSEIAQELIVSVNTVQYGLQGYRATVCEEKVDEESTVPVFTGQLRFSSLRNHDIMSMDCQPVHL